MRLGILLPAGKRQKEGREGQETDERNGMEGGWREEEIATAGRERGREGGREGDEQERAKKGEEN